MPVVGVGKHAPGRRSPAFAAGQAVELVVDRGAGNEAQTPSPSGPSTENARQTGDEPPIIEVWDAKMSVRAGRIPSAMAPRLSERLDAGEIGDCIVLWEELDGYPEDGRTGLRLLLIHHEIGVES